MPGTVLSPLHMLPHLIISIQPQNIIPILQIQRQSHTIWNSGLVCELVFLASLPVDSCRVLCAHSISAQQAHPYPHHACCWLFWLGYQHLPIVSESSGR